MMELFLGFLGGFLIGWCFANSKSAIKIAELTLQNQKELDEHARFMEAILVQLQVAGKQAKRPCGTDTFSIN